ncbi:MAG: hypothetical protein GY804_06950 [Alphaproteobacteria bacterium]|nr:hypothetical protein [Alphaproteobacteria bacterium]
MKTNISGNVVRDCDHQEKRFLSFKLKPSERREKQPPKNETTKSKREIPSRIYRSKFFAHLNENALHHPTGGEYEDF